jgi:hypothetical protein
MQSIIMPAMDSWLSKIKFSQPPTFRRRIEFSVMLGQLLLKTIGDTNKHHTLQRRNSQIALLIDSDSSDTVSAVNLMLRRIGFSSPEIPPLNMKEREAWIMTDEINAEKMSRILMMILHQRVPDDFFMAVTSGMKDYGGKIKNICAGWDISDGLSQIKKIWKTHHRDAPPEDRDDLLYTIMGWFFSMEIPDRLLLIQDLDPDGEWFPDFQPAILANYENQMRQNMAQWLLHQGRIIPSLLPNQVAAMAESLH